MDEKYQRIKVLGKGSFGKAYLVKNTEANELCVVKQMETSMMEPKERNEAVKEAMLLKRMDHPNIVRFQEVFMTRKGRLCIVMDFADGGDVHAEIKRREGKLLPEARIFEWFVQICFALKHVHERKVLHRDLKTQNIFLMASGQIKLGDFGIARVLDATKDYAKTMVGTPYYLSPEIIEDRPYNFKSDVWSCGVVLYEMTTLKHPFDADSLVILAGKILKDQYPLPDPSYSSNLIDLIKTMLCKDAKLRPTVPDILNSPFLLAISNEANTKYGLGLDLSEFGKGAAGARAATPDADAGQRMPSDGAAAAAKPGLAERRRQEVSAAAQEVSAAAQEADSVLMGTVAAPAKAAAQEAATSAAEEDGGDDEYEEEFEDYSGGSEDGERNPAPSGLAASVANLKIGGGGDQPPAGAGAGQVPPGADATGPSRIGAKAESLRAYLCEQVPKDAFEKAYALVRASGETSADVLQSRVSDVIGEEKAPELFTLFQLLCFLEDVAAGSSTEGESK